MHLAVKETTRQPAGGTAIGTKRGDFPVFAGTAEVEGCEETINEIVCDSTGVLSAVPPRGRALTTLMQGGPAENTASAGDSVWPLDTKFRVPIQFRR